MIKKIILTQEKERLFVEIVVAVDVDVDGDGDGDGGSYCLG